MRTDKEIQVRRPELVILEKEGKSCQIIDMAIQEDCRVREKEDEKYKILPEKSEECGQ